MEESQRDDFDFVSPSGLSPVLVHPGLSTNASTVSAASRRSDLSTAQEAEVISRATTHAISAARSILLAGGTQSSALYTAKAAAQSVLLPKSIAGERPPLTPSGKGFFGRRKNKKQAEIIASVALVSVNSALHQSPRGSVSHHFIQSPLHNDVILREPGANASGVYSEFSDDITTQQRSVATHQQRSVAPSVVGLSLPTLPFTSQKSLVTSPTPSTPTHNNETLVASVPPKKPHLLSMKEPEYIPTSSESGLSQRKSQVVRDPSLVVNKDLTPLSLHSMNFLEYFVKKQARAAESQPPKNAANPCSPIPEQMPMPRSITDRSKSRNDLAAGNAATDDPIYETSVLSSQHNAPQTSVSSSATESEASENNLTLDASNGSHASSEGTGDVSSSGASNEDFATLDGKDETSTFFSVDPLITSFNDVFSCGGDALPPLSQQQHRDNIETLRDDGFNNDDRRDRPLSSNLGVDIDIAVSTVDSENLLRDLLLAEKSSKSSRKHKSKLPTSVIISRSEKLMSMEYVVMRALGSMPTSPSSQQPSIVRPTLNINPQGSSGSAQRREKRSSGLHRKGSMSAYSVMDSSSPVLDKITVTESKQYPPTLVAPMSSSSISANYEQRRSDSGDESSRSVGVKNAVVPSVLATPKSKRKGMSWIRRNKNSTQTDVE